MNPKKVIAAIKKRSLQKRDRKYIYAYSKHMIEESYGTSQLLYWFNIYSTLNKCTVDWFKKREGMTMESRKEIVRMSIEYMKTNSPHNIYKCY